MIQHLTLILLFQLVGETLTRSFGLVLPGPVLGMALMLVFFIAVPKVARAVAPTAQALLSHLSLLFVPAGVGVINHLDALGANGPALFAALLVSTTLAISVGALVFVGLSRLTGAAE